MRDKAVYSVAHYVAEDMNKVDKFIAKRSHNLWFEARMMTDDHKDKKVYCYISPKVILRFCMELMFVCKKQQLFL